MAIEQAVAEQKRGRPWMLIGILLLIAVVGGSFLWAMRYAMKTAERNAERRVPTAPAISRSGH